MKKFKKGDKISIEERLSEMRELLKPFIKKYHQPVLVHATPNDFLFKKILRDGKLIVPKRKKNINHSFIERILKVYPCIFLSLGFSYASSYDFKYNLIFDLNYLKEADYYKNSISYKCYLAIIQYWDKNNPEYLKRLANTNSACKEVIHKFYNQEYLGQRKVLFDFWKVEKETFSLMNKYPRKRDLVKIMKKVANGLLIKYPQSLNFVKKTYYADNIPEIIVKKDIPLLNNTSFLGFYIRGKVPKEVKSFLVKRYGNKILFDGKKIIYVDSLRKN